MAKSLASEGAKVVINYPTDATTSAAEAVLNSIKSDGGEGMTFKADVGKEVEVQDMFSQTIKEYGTVDILVNNAGLQKTLHLPK